MLNNFSANMIKTYQTCPKKFYYKYIEKINLPQKISPFEKGKKIHALANYYLQGINISRIETALNTEEQIIWNKLLNNKYYMKDVLKSEFPLEVRLKNFWFGGRLDAIVYSGAEYYILDYKTGGIPKDANYDVQTMIYLTCADKYLENYNSLSFVYIDLKNDKDLKIAYTQKMKDEYVTKLIDIAEKISKDSYYKKNINSCENCEYYKICKK